MSSKFVIIARLITYFDNFNFGFASLRLVAWFSVQCFLFARQDGQDKMKTKQTAVKLDFKELLNKEQIDFKELAIDS